MNSSFASTLATVENVVTNAVIAATVVSDGLLVSITVHSKDLRSPCNLLIAVDAGCFLVYQLYILVEEILFPLFWSNTLDVWFCFLIISAHFVVIEMFTVLPMIIAVERLLNVLFPIWAQTNMLRLKRYVLTLISPAFLYAVAITVYFGLAGGNSTSSVLPKSVKAQECNPKIAYAGTLGSWLPMKSYAITLACWVIYGMILGVFRWRRSHSNVTFDESFQRLIRSLFVIVVLVTFGSLVSPILATVLTLMKISPEMYMAVYPPISLWTFDLSSAFTLPGLYIISKEYRRATNKFFTRFTRPIKTLYYKIGSIGKQKQNALNNKISPENQNVRVPGRKAWQ